MTFATPLWLLGLIPWSAVVLYLLWGRRPKVNVPFLDLWPAQTEGVKVRRRVSPPPIALALAILSMLIAILAAAQPEIRRAGVGPKITLILDRGYTMSARASHDRVTRLSETLDKIKLPGPVERVIVPSGNSISPTALETRDALRLAVRSALSRNPGPAVLLSDQQLSLREDRVIQIFPENSVKNARIVSIEARETPAAQVMVRVRGGPDFRTAKVRVTTGDQHVEREISFSFDGDADEFFDFAKLGETIRTDLLVDDDQPADNSAWLVRGSSWPRIESRVPLPPHLQRMMEVYAKQRPPSESSKRLVIVESLEQLSPEDAGVVVAPVSSSASDGRLIHPEVVDHPLTHGVAWTELHAPALASSAPPTAWTPIVSAGGKVWVAVRELPTRAVWIGFDTSEWAKSSEFVVFWANVFNWAGAGGDRFASHPVGSLEGEWKPVELAESVAPPEPNLWPGLYRRADGTIRALNAPEIPFPSPPKTNSPNHLDQLITPTNGQLPLAPPFAFLALVCLGGAAIAWKRRDPAARSKA